jgi:cysteine synthase B
VQVWAIEPPAGEMVDGLKSLDEGYIPPIFEDGNGADLLDRKKVVGPRDSIEGTRQLLDVGIFAGISSGAALVGAQRCAADIEEGVVVFIAADGGWKYLSTDLWTRDLDELEDELEASLLW